ncbi:MAG: NADH-quinone oxidoreductase subunit C [bacterium]
MAEDAGTTEKEGNASESEAPETPKDPPGKELRDLVEAEHPGAVLEQSAFKDLEDEVTFVLKPDDLKGVGAYLRDHPAARFSFLTDLTAAHYPEEEEPFQVLYHLYSFDHNRRLRLKVKVREGQEVPSVTEIWSSANWMEREVYDLFGVRFSDHPDLRRIMLPEDWGSHPFRKDYPLEGRGERTYVKPVRKEIGE